MFASGELNHSLPALPSEGAQLLEFGLALRTKSSLPLRIRCAQFREGFFRPAGAQAQGQVDAGREQVAGFEGAGRIPQGDGAGAGIVADREPRLRGDAARGPGRVGKSGALGGVFGGRGKPSVRNFAFAEGTRETPGFLLDGTLKLRPGRERAHHMEPVLEQATERLERVARFGYST